MMDHLTLFNWSLQALILTTGAMGQLFVAKRNIVGFYFWIVCNIALVYTAYESNPIQFGNLLLYAFYTFMCFYSIYRWKIYDRTPTTQPPPYDWDVLQLIKPAHPTKRTEHRDIEHQEEED